jgi:hypothetical protein
VTAMNIQVDRPKESRRVVTPITTSGTIVLERGMVCSIAMNT